MFGTFDSGKSRDDLLFFSAYSLRSARHDDRANWTVLMMAAALVTLATAGTLPAQKDSVERVAITPAKVQRRLACAIDWLSGFKRV